MQSKLTILGTYQFKSHETIRQKVAIIKSLFTFALREEYIARNPAIRIPPLKPHLKISNRRLTEEEVFRMIDRTKDVRDKLRRIHNCKHRPLDVWVCV
jgi:site-specific recombinase XerD